MSGEGGTDFGGVWVPPLLPFGLGKVFPKWEAQRAQEAAKKELQRRVLETLGAARKVLFHATNLSVDGEGAKVLEIRVDFSDLPLGQHEATEVALDVRSHGWYWNWISAHNGRMVLRVTNAQGMVS